MACLGEARTQARENGPGHVDEESLFVLTDCQFEYRGSRYQVDLSRPLDISLPVRFDDKQFSAFGAEPASCRPYQAGSTILSVSEGAGVNCPVFHFSAHLHGTHTECLGHITEEAHILQDCAPHLGPVLASVVSVMPAKASETAESYRPFTAPDDLLITRESLQREVGSDCPEALIIRTFPNDESKKTRDYSQQLPPYLSNQATEFLNQLQVQMLLIDTPSVDRLEDQGVLSNHHLFWGLPEGSSLTNLPSARTNLRSARTNLPSARTDLPSARTNLPSARTARTITEFVFVPNEVPDGLYLLIPNVSNIRSDAAPSRPTLYEVSPI